MKEVMIDAVPAAGQDPADDKIGKLKEIATQVTASIKTLGLHGKGVSGAKGRCNTIRKVADTKKQMKAGEELAASLRKGNADAQKIAVAIIDVLQMKLPGVDDAGGSPGDAPAAATPGPTEAPTDTEIPAPVMPVEVRQVATDKVKISNLFRGLFASKPGTVKAIAEDMQARGFDAAHPVVIWLEQGTVIDGHCRLQAAKEAGIGEVPAVYRSFADEDAALDYAIHTQRDRRNLTDADIICMVEQLDKRRGRGGDRRSEQAKINAPDGAVERSSQETADRIGVSSRTVERARQVLDSGKSDVIGAVKSGEKTIHKAVADVRKPTRKKPGKATDSKAAKRAVEQLNDIANALKPYGDAFKDIRVKLENLAEEIKTRAAEIQKQQSDQE